ncbi:MAG: chaperone modulator CbpM [Sulfuricaulis sp.]
MKVELTEVLWLDEHLELSLTELAELSGLSEVDLRELVDYGAIAPVDPRAASPIFLADCVMTARTACRLRSDFELDVPELALALNLLNRIRGLEAQLRDLNAQWPQPYRKKS